MLSVLFCIPAERSAAASVDQASDAVRQARGSLMAVETDVCAEVQPPVCDTLQGALAALDQTGIKGETPYSLKDVPQGLATAVASLSKAGNPSPALANALSKARQAQAEMFEEYVNRSLGELRADSLTAASVDTASIQAELGKALQASNAREPSPISPVNSLRSASQAIAAAENFISLAKTLPHKDQAQAHLDSAQAELASAAKQIQGSSSQTGGRGSGTVHEQQPVNPGQARGFSVLSLLSVGLSLVPVIFLACLLGWGPLSRKAGAGEARRGETGSLELLRAAATKASAQYKTLLEQNQAYQEHIDRLTSENDSLRRLLSPREGREGGRTPAMERDRSPDRGSEETNGTEDAEPTLTKSGPGIPPLKGVISLERPSRRDPKFEVERVPAQRSMRNPEPRTQGPDRHQPETAAMLDDPLEDYQKARSTGDTDEEARFKRKYNPCYTLSCTNLAQRGIAGARLTFRQDPRASFLAVTANDGRTLLFPQFSKELAFTPGMMEGVFNYPDGAISELRLTQAAEVKPAGEEWVLVRPGQFEHA